MDKDIKEYINKTADYLDVLCHLIVAILCVVVLQNEHPIVLFCVLSFILSYIIYTNEMMTYKIVAIGFSIYALKISLQWVKDVNSRTLDKFKDSLWEMPFWSIVAYYLLML